MHKAREAILVLKPVTFRYKPEIDPEKVPQFGTGRKGEPQSGSSRSQPEAPHCSLRSGNAMLLNEFRESLINLRMGVGVLNNVKITQQAGSYVFRSRYILPLRTNVGNVYTFLGSRNRMISITATWIEC